MADRVIEQEGADTFRASVLAEKHDITIEEARALKDTGVLVIKTTKQDKKEKGVADGDADLRE